MLTPNTDQFQKQTDLCLWDRAEGRTKTISRGKHQEFLEISSPLKTSKTRFSTEAILWMRWQVFTLVVPRTKLLIQQSQTDVCRSQGDRTTPLLKHLKNLRADSITDRRLFKSTAQAVFAAAEIAVLKQLVCNRSPNTWPSSEKLRCYRTPVLIFVRTQTSLFSNQPWKSLQQEFLSNYIGVDLKKITAGVCFF